MSDNTANIIIEINKQKCELVYDELIINNSVEEGIPITTFTVSSTISKPVIRDNVRIYDELTGDDIFKGHVTNILSQGFINGIETFQIEAQGYKVIFQYLQSLISFPENVKVNDIIESLVLKANTEGTGVTEWGITIGEIDDYSEYDDAFAGGTSYGSDSISTSLNNLAETLYSYWGVDNEKRFFFKKIETAPKFNHGDIPIVDFIQSKTLTNFEYEVDHTLQRNAHTEFGKETDTTEYIIDNLRGQDDAREYVLRYPVSKNITVRLNKNDGGGWQEQSIAVKTDDGTEPNTQWSYTAQSNTITHNSSEPTLPPTYEIEVKYIGLVAIKARVTDETVISKLSTRLGVDRALVEIFEENQQANTQKELMLIANSKLAKYTLPISTYTLETRLPLGITPGQLLDTKSLIIKGVEFEADFMLCVAIETSILKNIHNKLINPIYTYTFNVASLNPTLATYIRRGRVRMYEQDSTVIDIVVPTSQSIISTTFEDFEIIEVDAELWPKSDLYAGDSLYAGNGSVN